MTSLLRRTWACLPPALRTSAQRLILRTLAPRPDDPAPQGDGPVTVAGPFRSATGIGEGARLCATALSTLGMAVDAFDLTTAFARIDLDPLPPLPTVPGSGGNVIIHLNAPYMARAMLWMGRRRLEGRRVIGYWAWELPSIPPSWREGFDYVHEVWAPSTFCADAIRPYAACPVRVVPHPVAPPQPSGLTRADFGLPDDRFIVLSMLHLGSGFARKNPLAAIRAFRRAFGQRDDVLLVVKAVADIPLPWAEKALDEAVAGASNIKVIRRVMTKADQASLLACADVVMSLHRSEGFGLALAEAMLLGKPVIATGWSGNMDFMTDGSAALVRAPLVPVDDPQGAYSQRDQVWAEPDEDDAAAWLCRLQADRDEYQRMGAAAMAEAEARLSLPAYAAAIRQCGMPNMVPPLPAVAAVDGLNGPSVAVG